MSSVVLRDLSEVSHNPVSADFSRVQFTTLQKVRNLALAIFSVGFFWAIQQLRFHHAMKRGDIEAAASALSWGAVPYLSKKAICALEAGNQLKPLQFLAAQIDFDPQSPKGGSMAAEAFIEARDDRRGISPALLKILPFSRFPRTYLFGNPFNWAPRDEYYKEVSYFRSFNPSHGRSYDDPFRVYPD